MNGKGWTAVRDLRPGDELGNTDGAQLVVEGIDDSDHDLYFVYNLHVEDFHTYFVGTGIWVHNQKISELNSVKKLEEVSSPPAMRENPALTEQKHD